MVYHFKNISIYYEIQGEGPAVVLLHGFLESSTMWQPLLPFLSETKTVISIDFPGHGQSGVIAETHSMELMAEVVNEILLQLQIKSATFVGHSMGGYVALAYTELFSGKVDALYLLNSNPLADSVEKKNNRNRALKVIDQNPNAYISMAISNLIAETSRKNFSEEIEGLKNEAYTFPVDGIKAAIKGMRDRKNRTAVLKNFQRKKHVILAEEDPILPFREAKTLAENYGAAVKIIEGGHMSLIENRKAVTNYLLLTL